MLQALQRSVTQFRTRKEVWPLRVPREPLTIGDIARRTLDRDAPKFELTSLRSRSLMSLTWDDGSRWELWTIALESGVRLYCDSNSDESRILASARRDSEIDPDRRFLELLSESAGEIFGIGLEGGPPSRVRSTIDDRELLVDFFVNLFEVSGMEEDVRVVAKVASEDFRSDVASWLKQTLR
jgi:hypothetical protein